jgi:tripeptidyl-peptidase-1
VSSFSLIYPQTVTLYQVDDQLYEPVEVATTNLFNTFLDALDGVSISTRIIRQS